MRGESQMDIQAFVAKNSLLVSNDGIGILRVEGRKGIWLVYTALDQGDLDGFIRIARP